MLSSPTGQQFLSCKEVASFLESFFGLNNSERQDGDGGEDIQEDCIVATENVSISVIIWLNIHWITNILQQAFFGYNSMLI